MNDKTRAAMAKAAHFTHDDFSSLLDKAAHSAGISTDLMVRQLDSPQPEFVDKLFAAARAQRDLRFGNRVFLYGFLYVSTHCRNRCSFCYYRKNNLQAPRYRKTHAQVIALARELADSGVHLIDLTAGEDPFFYREDGPAFDLVVDMVQNIKIETGLPVMASVGVVPDGVMDRLAAVGADWYACYQETHNRQLFEKLRLGQSYQARLQSKIEAKQRGMLIEEGLLCGVGENASDLLASLNAMADLKADQVRVMTFVPQAGTPMKGYPHIDAMRELIVIALMRLVFPDLLIPASLDVDGLAGLRQRLNAGANVVTSLVPPGKGLAGVAQSALDIEDGRRTVKGIGDVLRCCGLEPASADRYKAWLKQRRPATAAKVGNQLVA